MGKHASLRLAKALELAGMQRGSTIAMLLPNGIECHLILWVSAILQLTLMPLDPGIWNRARREQLEDYIKRLSPETVILGDNTGLEAIDETAETCGATIKARIAFSQTTVPGWTSVMDLVERSLSSGTDSVTTPQDISLEGNGERVAVILFTSGTSSGRPKGCPLSVKNVLNCAINDMAAADLTSTWILPSAPFRAMWLIFSLNNSKRGAHIVSPALAFSTSTVLDAIELFDDGTMVCIPVQIHLFAQDPTLKSRRTSSMKPLILGGDMVTTNLVSLAQACFPAAQIDAGHAMTEGGGTSGWRGHSVGREIPQFHGILSAGLPAPGALLRIYDDDGRTLQRNEIGELHLGGPSVITHYLNDEQPQSFYSDVHGHWILTGDRAFMDDHDRVFIVGRSKDIIKKTGVSLSPAVIEAVMNDIEGVQVGY